MDPGAGEVVGAPEPGQKVQEANVSDLDGLLPGLFAARKLGLLNETQAMNAATESFSPAVVRSMTDVIPYTTSLDNLSSGQGNA